MTARFKSFICIFFALVLCVLISGCSYVGAEELYSLPEVSENYILLQKAIDRLIDQGAEYSSPVSGSFRQAVQLRDLDGDGVQEVLAFMEDTGENPLKLYIFKSSDSEYEIVGTIEGTGTAFDSLTYTDLDGDGQNEMLVGFRMGQSLQLVSAYSLRNLRPSLLFTANYSKLICCDMTNDGRSDLLVLRLSAQDAGNEAELFSIGENGDILCSTSPVTQNVASVSKLLTGRLNDSTPAVFADLGYSDENGDGILTDIFIYSDGLKNITLGGELTSRKTSILCRDINGDGFIEVPRLRPMASFTVTDWYRFSEDGGCDFSLTTYHNSTDSWYLTIPEEWKNVVSISRQDSETGERVIIFSYRRKPGTDPVDFLSVYTLSGENKEERASVGGRFILKSTGDTLYAASLASDFSGIPFSVTEEDITEAFHIIYSDWQS